MYIIVAMILFLYMPLNLSICISEKARNKPTVVIGPESDYHYNGMYGKKM